MKIGFSSLVCPEWDLPTIIENASAMGFDGVELRGLVGELNLPLVPALAGDPPGVRKLFADRGVELVALGTSATVDSPSPKQAGGQKATITEFIELAGKLACPYVRIFLGGAQRGGDRQSTLGRVAEALGSLADVAARFDVTLLVENGGDFSGSRELWFVVDAVAHPALRCCWNQCNAMVVGERPTGSIPRLAEKIGMVHVCDADFDDRGILLEYKPLGEGSVEIERLIELLRGVLCDRYLVFEWPRTWVKSLPEPQAVLPGVAKFLRERIDARQPVLSAYKGDKRAPKIASR